jgi:hypothetical protein
MIVKLYKKEHHIYSSNTINLTTTISCRLILICLGSYFVQMISCVISTKLYALFILTLIILIDTVYICIKKNGIDFEWFSPAYLAFSFQIIFVLREGTKGLQRADNIACFNQSTTLLFIRNVENGTLKNCGLVYKLYHYKILH